MSKSRCKVGDRCFVIASTFPDNIGRIVRIVSSTDHMTSRKWPPGIWWRARSEGSPLRGVNNDDSECWTLEAYALDGWLLPICGDEGEPAAECGKHPRKRHNKLRQLDRLAGGAA